MRKDLLAFAVALSIALGGWACGNPPAGRGPEAEAAIPVRDVLAAPSKYDGEVVRLCGYFNAEYEGTALFPAAEDARAHRATRGVWISVTWPLAPEVGKLGGQYVLVRGRFRAGARGSFIGELQDRGDMVPVGTATQCLPD